MIIRSNMCQYYHHHGSKMIFLILMAAIIAATSSGDNSNDDESLENKSYHAPHQCPSEFLDRCHCGLRSFTSGPYIGKGRLTFVTNCTDSNFTMGASKIFHYVPDETEVLILNGNNFPELSADLLPARHEKLILVDLSRNGIEKIDKDAFRNMPSVRTLILDDNRIRTEAPIFAPLVNLEELRLRKAFDDSMADGSVLQSVLERSKLSQLKILDLGSNHLRRLDNSTIFCAMSQLRQLILAHNRLDQLNFDPRCLTELRLLDISDNQIDTVDNKTIQILFGGNGTFRVNISENPFRCDCHLKDFFGALQNRSVKQRLEWLEELRCYNGRYLDQIREDDLRCDELVGGQEISMVNLIGNATPSPEEKREAIRRYRRYITMSYVILTALLFILTTLIGVLIYTNRENLRTSWAILMAGVSKRDYTQLSDGQGIPPGPSTSRIQKKWWHRRLRKPQPPSLITYHPPSINDVAEEQV